MTSLAANFQYGYIVSQRSDALWFVTLPFLAFAAAMLAEAQLPAVWAVAVSFVVTVPHQGVTFLRVYASPAELRRWPRRLVAGPLILIPAVAWMSQFDPWSLVLILTLWDHQHSIMQQYGFGRIYDFKAGTGGERTPRFDFYLNWVLFVNMLIVSEVFTRFWIRLLLEAGFTPSPEMVQNLHAASWSFTAIYLVFYVGHVIGTLREGRSINPGKYLFLAASYFLWYSLAFATVSLVVWSIGHRIMHGIQYIVMVYFYNRNNIERTGGDSALLRYLGQPGAGHVAAFVGACGLYAVAFWQLSLERHFSQDYDIFAYSLISSFALLHYYMDAFIWKIRRPELSDNL